VGRRIDNSDNAYNTIIKTDRQGRIVKTPRHTAGRRSRLTAVFTVAVAGVVVLSGCGSSQAGKAVVMDDYSITEAELNDQVQQILVAQGRSPDAASQALVVTTIDRMITTNLVDAVALDAGVEATQGEIDAALVAFSEQAGGMQAFEDSLLAQDIAPSQIESIMRLNILAERLGQALDPAGSQEAQSAALLQAVVDKSVELGTEVSPRYGTWDGPSLQVGPAVNDLSIPFS
jgi:SurA N-terminal domain